MGNATNWSDCRSLHRHRALLSPSTGKPRSIEKPVGTDKPPSQEPKKSIIRPCSFLLFEGTSSCEMTSPLRRDSLGSGNPGRNDLLLVD
ncbi:hypothetical protein HL42_6909 [Trichophyton rubrum]|nr:hypothetical protein HL42_6909 [Trichophyton rubrum]